MIAFIRKFSDELSEAASRQACNETEGGKIASIVLLEVAAAVMRSLLQTLLK